MLNLILFGPPGGGKGTQAEKIVEKFGLIHLSTGNLLRQEISDKTALGIAAKNFIDNGQLVPDEVVIGMIDSCLEKNASAKGFLFDGFPRNLAQVEALDKLLDYRKNKINKVIKLDVPDAECMKRLTRRGETSGRSDDASEDVNRKRLEIYHSETAPCADYYSSQNKLVVIHGVGSSDDIFNEISNVIESEITAQQSVSAQ
ncbi:MAG TPA: adenylate kinase [Flavisolibacter sp.]